MIDRTVLPVRLERQPKKSYEEIHACCWSVAISFAGTVVYLDHAC